MAGLTAPKVIPMIPAPAVHALFGPLPLSVGKTWNMLLTNRLWQWRNFGDVLTVPNQFNFELIKWVYSGRTWLKPLCRLDKISKHVGDGPVASSCGQPLWPWGSLWSPASKTAGIMASPKAARKWIILATWMSLETELSPTKPSDENAAQPKPCWQHSETLSRGPLRLCPDAWSPETVRY